MSKTTKFNPDAMISRGMPHTTRMEVGKVLAKARREADRRQDDRMRAEPDTTIPAVLRDERR